MREKKCKAYTLVEALIVVALTVVILGLALDAYIETVRATNAVSDQLVAAREAQTIAQQIEKLFLSRVAGEKGEKFAAEEVIFTGLQPAQTKEKAPALATAIERGNLPAALRSVHVSNDIERRRVVLTAGDDRGAKKQILGTNSDAFCAEVSFAYAEEIKDFTPQWRDVTSTEPLLAKVVVHVWPRLPGMATFEEAQKARAPRYAETELWVKMR
ncbi:MAG: pilus assembly FimT family protein [Candidatus Sumerlaeaceae bacterium]|jgi:type II secretory pathway pseudopilin PulG